MWYLMIRLVLLKILCNESNGFYSAYLPSGEARSPAEWLIAVDDGIIHDLGIRQDKAGVG